MKNNFSKTHQLVDLRRIFSSSGFAESRSDSLEANPFFTSEMVDRSAEAICDEMLSGDKLRHWLSGYQRPADFHPRRVGIIAAGNIPMVGFLDLLCAVVVGHAISLKPSSKDRPLMEFVASQMPADIDIVNDIDRYDIDMLIATGSNDTALAIQQKYHGIPSIIRGSRHSVACLSGNETTQQLQDLNDDIFLYFGLGCRNVSHIFLPHNYNIQTLLKHLKPHHCKAFQNQVAYQRAIYSMRGEQFIDARTFLLKEIHPDTTPPLGVVGYSFYNHTPQFNPKNIQCTVGIPQFPRNVTFGKTQTPALNDYPDNIDIIDFLLK